MGRAGSTRLSQPDPGYYAGKMPSSANTARDAANDDASGRVQSENKVHRQLQP
jgi:hypothetical protein